MTSTPLERSVLEALYQDLHRHPELSFDEHRTSGIIVARLRELGVEVITNIAGTGVVGVLRNGPGPTVMLRADMDALPVQENTGLPYASTARAQTSDGRDVPVMHACGHDVHMACLLGAVDRLLASRGEWTGTLIALFQPAEESGGGAQAMVNSGLYSLVPRPDIVLGQHVFPFASGTLGAHGGAAMSVVDSLRVRMFGRGGHGSEPETTIDPVVMSAATVMRLQGVVSREVGAQEAAVVSVGSLHVGSESNIVADEALLGISIRSFTEDVRGRVLAAVERIVLAEAAASGATVAPEITAEGRYPVTVNEPMATERTMAAFRVAFGDACVIDPGPIAASEDVGNLAAAGAPLVYWMLGGCDARAYATAVEAGTVRRDIPSNHSPRFAPEMQPTLDTGVGALVVAAREWLGGTSATAALRKTTLAAAGD
jgi:hippurate hydrolase